jgi:hypothetical protein
MTFVMALLGLSIRHGSISDHSRGPEYRSGLAEHEMIFSGYMSQQLRDIRTISGVQYRFGPCLACCFMLLL